MHDNELLDENTVAVLTGRATSTIQKSRLRGDGPPFVRLGRSVRYRRRDLQEWIDSLPAIRSTSESPGGQR
jgi:predicted DNA-binding transcriptional regulator AlpA